VASTALLEVQFSNRIVNAIAISDEDDTVLNPGLQPFDVFEAVIFVDAFAVNRK